MCSPYFNLDLGCVPENHNNSTQYTRILNYKEVKGRIAHIYSIKDIDYLPKEYNTIIINFFKPEMTPILNKVEAIISEMGGLGSHGAIVAKEFNKAYLLNPVATKTFFFGDYIEIKENKIKITESDFFAPAEPIYPTSKYYKQYLYRYYLSLLADFIIEKEFTKNLKFCEPIENFYAIKKKPSEHYKNIKKTTFGKKLLDLKTNEIQTAIKLNILQKISFSLTPKEMNKIANDLVYEDFYSINIYKKNFENKTITEIFENLKENAIALFELIK